MNTNGHELTTRTGNSLFDRVVIILEQARTNVVRTVNSEMVLAYWHIGREIVQELQKGENRAEYGKQIIKELSAKLNKKYGKGFSSTNLWYFRQFYVVYSNRSPKIRHKACGVLDDLSYTLASRIISDTIDVGLIRLHSGTRRDACYVPFWA